MGAVMPSTRSAPVKVVVFQCPCGTAARVTLFYQRAASQPGHLGRGASFADVHQAPWINIWLGCEPGPALDRNVGPLLLGCVGYSF